MFWQQKTIRSTCSFWATNRLCVKIQCLAKAYPGLPRPAQACPAFPMLNQVYTTAGIFQPAGPMSKVSASLADCPIIFWLREISQKLLYKHRKKWWWDGFNLCSFRNWIWMSIPGVEFNKGKWLPLTDHGKPQTSGPLLQPTTQYRLFQYCTTHNYLPQFVVCCGNV